MIKSLYGIWYSSNRCKSIILNSSKIFCSPTLITINLGCEFPSKDNSDRVITPEGGCVHVAAGLNKYVTVIYDNDNLPEYIYTEYMPWKTKHQKLVFGINEINKEILRDLN